MDEKTLEALPEVFVQRYQKVYDRYLKLVGKHVKDMEELTASDIHKLNELAKMNANVSRIKIELNNLIKQNTEDLYIAVAKVSEAEYKSFAELYRAKGILQGDITANIALVKRINSIAKTTAETFINMANTTVMKRLYKNVVDEAVIAVSSGVIGYNKAIADTIKKTAIGGNTVEYASGLTRRRDSAVRMNVLEGIRQINMGISEATGKEFGSDGVEISVHNLCAEDHIGIQGRQYSNKEFEQLNNNLDRPIGTLNCHHFTFPIILGISSSTYSKKELADINKRSTETIEIDGISKTRYQWSQEQRKLETAVRNQKDIANVAKSSGNNALRQEAQNKINEYTNRYAKLCKQTGLEPRSIQMQMSGFSNISMKKVETIANTMYNKNTVYSNIREYLKDKPTIDLLASKGFTYKQRISRDEILIKLTRKIEINDTTFHFLDNLENRLDRGLLTVSECQNIVDSAQLILYQEPRKTIKYLSDNGYVVLNLENDIITAVPQKWRKKYNQYL